MRIDVQAVSKRFGDFRALDDVTLVVPEGSLTALLGPSGSGKSTLLRIIAGLETPDTGSILIADKDVTAAKVQDRCVGFVFQHYAAFAHMSVRENVAFGLRIRKRPKAEIRERVDELLALVGLSKWAQQRPDQLSGGQRQRMALARALAVQPRVLLLDEPFGALDANVRTELRRWLRRLHDEQHVTTVLVTHDQEEAMDVADTIAVMNTARIEQVGSPRDVYDRPATEFVMGFLGPVSQIDGRLVRPHDVTISLAPARRCDRGDGRARRAPRLRGADRARAARRRARTSAADQGAGRGARARARGHRLREVPGRGGRAQFAPRGQRRAGVSASAHRVTQASGSSASLSISPGSRPAAISATVTCSATLRRFARTAIQTRSKVSAGPG